MAASVAEINSLSLSSKNLFSKSFSHIKASQPHSQFGNLRSHDFETIDLHFSSIDYKTQFHSVQII